MKKTMLLVMLSSILVIASACSKKPQETNLYAANPVNYYTDIPGITEEEIEAIEAWKSAKEEITYGSLVGTELFRQPDGSLEGFTYRYCEFLSKLFGIPFQTVLFDDWDELKSKHDESEIDFMGELCPTPERMEVYHMTNPIAEHALRIFTRADSKEIVKVPDVEGLKVGFLADTITASYVKRAYPVSFEVVDVGSYEAAAKKLVAGDIDAFVEDADADPFFLDYDEIESKKFFSMVYSPISMTTANDELEPYISVIDKYLTAGGLDQLLTLYAKGEHEYAKYKLKRSLTAQEREYLEDVSSQPVKLALESDNYPVSFYNASEGRYQGIAVDILDEISNVSGIQFDVVTDEAMTWTEILEMLKTGEASMLSQLLYTEGRKGDYLWSDTPYSTSNYALLSRIDYPDLLNYQVSRAKVGTLKNSAHEYIFYEWFPEYENAKQYVTQNDGVSALDKGEIDLLMASEFLHLSQTNYYENSGLKINLSLSTPMDSYFGFYREEEALCSIISKVQSYIDTNSIERAWTSRMFDYQKKAATERTKYLAAFSFALFVVLVWTILLFVKNKRLSNNLSVLVAQRTSELERQTATLTTIYESMPDLVFSLDANFTYTSCNPSFERFAGLGQSEIIGKRDEDIFGDQAMADYFYRTNQKVLLEGRAKTIEETVTYPDGTRETLETIKTPLYQNGELIGLLGIARNITERKAADERAKLMLEATPLCCSLIDDELRVIDCNNHAVELYGLADKQEYKDRFDELSPERQPDGSPSIEKARGYIKEAFKQGRVVFEWTHQMPNGDPIPCEITLVRVKRGNDFILAGYTRDLRESQKMIREIEHKDYLLQTVNNAASILLQSEIKNFRESLHKCMGMMAGVVKVDRVYIWENFEKDGRLFCSQLYEWSEHVDPQQGKDITIDVSYNEIAPGLEETLSRGDCVNSLVRNLSSAEQAVLSPQGILSILIVPVFLRDAFWGFVGFDDCRRERTFSDDEVTVLRSGSIMIASALLRNEMTLDIQKAVEAAQEASRAKSKFLSNMSHEIRTPLNAITGMTTIGKTAADVRKKDYALAKIDEASSHLLGVINDILDMSKIEANKFELSNVEFNFEKMLQKVVGVVNFRIREKEQRFSYVVEENVPRLLVGDSQRLAQVITNLLSNAVKFTPEGKEIWLAARMLKEDDGVCTIRVDVNDSGIGIDPSRQPHIFESFEQAENNTTRKYGGTGLGLSISKYIVELMGGRIWLDSQLGKGSTFSFTILLERGVGEEEAPLDKEEEGRDEEPVSFEGRRFLLAEDVEINRDIVVSLLEQTGAQIDCAENGVEALRMFGSKPERYDLIFMDIQMPEMDGLEATRRIRSLGFIKAQEIPIIAMTANVFREDVEQCREAGMDDHVGKPLDMDELMGVIKKHLQTRAGKNP